MSWIGRTIAVVLLLTCMLAAGRMPETVVQVPEPQKSSQIDINEVFNGKKIKPFTKQQEKCLADNIYYEASNQPYEGKLGVAFVTMNRLADVNYPNSICSVVYEKKHPIYCQFSWVCEKPQRFDQKTWQDCLHVARQVINYVTLGIGKIDDPTHGALFFHTTEVSPRWKTAYIQTTQIADHIFYRKPAL